jgi:hypothetical protein
MAHKTVQLDGMDIRVEKTDDGITAEPVAPQDMDELVEAVREMLYDDYDVRNENGLLTVDNGPPLYTTTLRNIKSLGLSLSFIADGKVVFVHDELGSANYTYAYGADGSDQ